nr:GNAT family N-acetyltransferase [Azohydromonas aeria]
MDELSLADNAAAHRFELRLDGVAAAHAEYNLVEGAMLFTHTEVKPEYEGRGLGSRLAAYALDEVRKRGLRAIPACSFIAGYIRRHPEHLDLVSEDSRRAYRI